MQVIFAKILLGCIAAGYPLPNITQARFLCVCTSNDGLNHSLPGSVLGGILHLMSSFIERVEFMSQGHVGLD